MYLKIQYIIQLFDFLSLTYFSQPKTLKSISVVTTERISFFSLLNSIPFSLSIHPFVGHLGHFHILAIVNNAAMNMQTQITLRDSEFVSSSYISRNGFSGAYDSFTFIGGMGRLWSEGVFVHTLLCPTLCNPSDSSPPGSSVHGIFQAKKWRGLPFFSPEVKGTEFHL